MKLYPSILTDNLAEYEHQVSLARENDELEVIQVDIIDGYFAENLTVSPLDLTQVDYGELEIDFHLMVEEPMDYVQELAAIKDYLPIRAVVSQVERMSFQADYLEAVKEQGWHPGMSLDLFTPVSAIDNNSWLKLDVIQLMTVKAGFQNQNFDPSALDKIQPIRDKVRNQIEIMIDGGVKEEQLPLLKKKQVDSVSVGSGLWRSEEPAATIDHYLDLLD